MTTDLEDLVRDTLSGRAVTVTDGPTWVETPARRRVNQWVVAAAAAAVVVAAGTAVVAAQVLARRDVESAAGSAHPTCTAALPPAWKHALAGPAWTVGGLDAWPDAVAKDGTVIAAAVDSSGASYRTSLVTPDGHATALLTVPRHHLGGPWTADTDGRYAVFNFAPDERVGDSEDRPMNDVVIVDPHTGRRRHLLRDAPVPAGFVVAYRGAVIQSGIVYWGMEQPGDQPGRGIVLAYDVASRRYRVLAHLRESAAVLRDPRGVHWADGLVPATGVPTSVPVAPASLEWRQRVLSDGTSYAWAGRTDAPDAQVVYWARGAVQHHWRVVSSRRLGAFDAMSVSGPFIFGVHSNAGSNMYVLDTRTGAIAALAKQRYIYQATAAGSRVYLDMDASHPGRVPTVPIDTSKLPELRC